jgi:outer membrane PBP1 activator LpoA protein
MVRRTLTLFALAGALAGCGAEPKASVKEFMNGEVQPTADIYWKSVQYISDENGMHEIRPRTDAEWEDVRQAAVRLGELGAELKEARYAEGRGSAWTDYANGLIEIAAKAEKAAAEKSVEGVFDMGYPIYSVCQACHQAYPPADGAAEGGNDAG